MRRDWRQHINELNPRQPDSKFKWYLYSWLHRCPCKRSSINPKVLWCSSLVRSFRNRAIFYLNKIVHFHYRYRYIYVCFISFSYLYAHISIFYIIWLSFGTPILSLILFSFGYLYSTRILLHQTVSIFYTIWLSSPYATSLFLFDLFFHLELESDCASQVKLNYIKCEDEIFDFPYKILI